MTETTSNTQSRGVVLIPTANRSESLTRTITSLAQCSALEQVDEVLVINNGAVEQSESIEQLLRDTLDSTTATVVHEPRTGLSKALNRGLDHLANKHPGDRLLIRFDDDVDLPPNTLSTLLNAHGRWNGKAIFGLRITPLLPKGVPAESCTHLKSLMRPFYAEYDFGEQETEVRMPPFGPAMAAPLGIIGTERFDETLGYPKYYGEESEWLRHIRANTSAPFIYLPEAAVRHRIRPDQLEHQWRANRCRIAGATLAKIDRIRGLEEHLFERNIRRRRRRVFRSKLKEGFWRTLRQPGAAQYWAYKGAIHKAYVLEAESPE